MGGEQASVPADGTPVDSWMGKNLTFTCWWCGQPADTGEHKFKRSDLHRAFGRGAWGQDNPVIHVSVRGQGNLDSSNAARLKFTPVLCADCNSARSQPFDLAYERFADYFVINADRLLDEGSFDWAAVFPNDWRAGQLNVARYWVKHIGCRLAHEGVPVHPDLRTFLDGQGPLLRLSLMLSIQKDIAAAEAHIRDAHGDDFGETLWMGPASCEYSKAQGQIVRVWSHLGLKWLRLSYAYNFDVDGGETNFAERLVVLPHEHQDPPWDASDCLTCLTCST